MASLARIQAPAAVFQVLVLGATFARLYTRARKRQLWFDDVLAFCALLAFIGHIPVYHMMLSYHLLETQAAKVMVFYVSFQLYMAIIWLSRLSILMAGVRMTPKGSARQFLIMAAGGVVACWAGIAGQMLWRCVNEATWKEQPRPLCVTKERGLSFMTCFILSDILLAYAPIRLIWQTKVQPACKIRLTALFSSVFLCTAVGVYRAYAVLYSGTVAKYLAILVEMLLSLLATNLPVLAVLVFRASGEDSEVDVGYFTSFGLGEVSKTAEDGVERPISPSITLSSIHTLPTGGDVSLESSFRVPPISGPAAT